MPADPLPVVTFFDVDNTLLDNDRVIEELGEHLRSTVGKPAAAQYWTEFEELRNELGYADYLGALQRFRVKHPHVLQILSVSRFLIEYPFESRVYPGAREAVDRARKTSTVAILSDGDVVFQPHKIRRSGLERLVDDRVLIYVHKEQELPDIETRYPAGHYVVVDDKLRILTELKRLWGKRVTTVFVKQGHYATDPTILHGYPPADIELDSIGDFGVLG